MNIPHIPVLYNETLDAFKNINKDILLIVQQVLQVIVVGLLNQNENIKLICNDQDDEALSFSKKD